MVYDSFELFKQNKNSYYILALQQD